MDTDETEGRMATGFWLSITSGDLARSRRFYEALGFPIDARFTGERSVCVVVQDDVFLMVLERDFFATMTDKPVADPRTHALVGINIARGSRADVDAIAERGLAAGGTEPAPAQEHGSMYSRDLEDPDGNNIGFQFTPGGE